MLNLMGAPSDRQKFGWHLNMLAFAGLCCLLVFAARTATAAAHRVHVAARFVIADFDGDNSPDFASVHVGKGSSQSTRYWIAFHLSSGFGQTVGITAPTGGLQITSRDVNGDSFPDVIVTTAWTNKPVAILLNDGFGNFKVSSPVEFAGAFATSESAWTAAPDAIRDSAVALSSRCQSSDCRADSGRELLQEMIRLLSVRRGSSPVSASALPSIGRAPPSSLLS